MRFTPGVVAGKGSVSLSGQDAPASLAGLQAMTTASDTTATTVTNFTMPLGGAPVGSIVIAVVATDNTRTTNGQGMDDVQSFTDSKGNTYSLAYSWCNSQSQVKGGSTCLVFWTKVTTALVQSVDTFILTMATSSYARAMVAARWTIAAGQTLAVQAGNGTQASAGATPTASLAGQPSKQYLWLGAVGDEYDTYPVSAAGFTRQGVGYSQGGSAAANQCAALFYVISTATGMSFNPLTNGDCAAILVAFKEVYV